MLGKEHLILFILLFFLFSTKTVYAYLDPGTGSYLFQIIIATILGLLMTLKISWRKVNSFLKRILKQRKSTNNDVK